MEISISPLIVEKLSHSIEEIRVRALKSVEGKVIKALKGRYELNFQGVVLIRALLKWFNQESFSQEDVVLNVIFLVLNSKYGLEIVKHLTKDHLKQELSKIRRILCREEDLNLLDDIESVIEQTEENAPRDIPTIDLTDDLSPLVENIQIEEVELTPREYVRCWSIPNAVDLNSLKLLKESLDSGSPQDLNHALEFLSTAIEDYPAEFFLQPPYLVVKFQDLLAEGSDLKGILWKFNRILFKRIHILASAAVFVPGEATAAVSQISVSKYCSDTFKVVNRLLKNSEDQATINWCFDIFSQLVSLLTIDEHRLESTVKEILEELGSLGKFYRKCLGYKMQDFTARKLYIKVIKLIVELRRIPLHGVEDKISSQELSIARLDVAVKNCYPEIYRSIEAVCPRGEKSIETLLNCEELLRPAVTLLRPLQDFKDEELVMAGLEALTSIHQSTQLADKLIDAVANCVPIFPGNAMLRDSGEKIILHLLAHPCVKIRSQAYSKASEKMKYFVSSLVGGEQSIARRGFQGDNSFRSLGIPLTREILTEIIAFGCSSPDPIIHSSSETMLLFILQSRVVLKGQWKVLKDLLFPLLPLLQCWTSKSTKLGEAILSLLHPDCDLTNGLEVIEATVRLLFSADPSVRDEAVSRILYIVNSDPKAEQFLPRIDQIADTMANDLAILDYQIDMAARFRTNSHQEASVESLLDILKAENVEPSIRKTTLMQLSLLAMDPKVNERLMDCDAWLLVLEILDNCFKVDQTRDYVDVCVPAVSILCKFLLHCPQLRQDLSEEIPVYFILLRSLLMYQHDDNLKTDAVTALFLLAFSSYAVGSYRISLPRLMGRLKIPFLPHFHWSESPHQFTSPLEEILRESDDTDSYWQFLRISWANVWFGGLENVLENARNSKREGEDGQRINYSHVSDGKEIKLVKVMDFDERLRMTKKDLLLIHASLPRDSFRYFIHQIENATTHQEVSTAIAHIQCNLSLDPTKKFPMESLYVILKRFCLTPPATSEDCEMFGKILQLLRMMLDHDEGGRAREWLIDQVKIRNSVFTSIFLAPGIPLSVYEENARLLIKILKEFTGESNLKARNFLGEIFRAVLKALDGSLERENQLGKARVLIALLSCLTCSTFLEIDNHSQVINQILRYTASTKSLCQGGSKFILNCLMCIRGVLEMAMDVRIKSKHLKYVSGLCSHTDVWIRLGAWGILCKLAEDFSGAHSLIEDLKFLPGGFHACCIVTLLDDQESGCVREMAANTFANLISHRMSSGIAQQVSPRCSESEFEGDSVENLIMMIVRKHQVAEEIVKALTHFTIWDAVQDTDDEQGKILTCSNTVQGFCVILRAIIDVDPAYIAVLMEENCLQSLTNVLAQVPTNPSGSVMRMASGICGLLIPCLLSSEEILQCIVCQNHATISAVLFLQDESLYEENVQEMAMIFLKMLSVFGISSTGFHIVTNLMQEQNPDKLFSLLLLGLKADSSEEFQLASLEFLAIYLKVGFSQENANFLHIIDPNCEVTADLENEENINPNTVNSKGRPQSSQGGKLIVTSIFQKLQKLFETACVRDKPEVASFRTCAVKKNAGGTLGSLLRCSKTARYMAKFSELFSFLVKRLEATATSLGASAADFVRRHGEMKKKPIVNELVLITDILCGWFAADILDDPADIEAICRVILRLWSWNGSSRHLQTNFWLLIKLLSEQSYAFCRRISTPISGFPQTILHLIITLTVQETNRAKQQEVDISRLRLLLRVLTNCCSCIEGRLMMIKQGVLNNISQFHPSVTRLQRSQHQVIEEWLKFYEILARYPEGEPAKHLKVLCALVEQKHQGIRKKCVEILRNFAFADPNTAALLVSEDFKATIKIILDGSDREDQINIAAAIWSIIENNHRATNAIRTSSIPGKLVKIQNLLVLEDSTESKLYQLVEIIMKILNQ